MDIGIENDYDAQEAFRGQGSASKPSNTPKQAGEEYTATLGFPKRQKVTIYLDEDARVLSYQFEPLLGGPRLKSGHAAPFLSGSETVRTGTVDYRRVSDISEVPILTSHPEGARAVRRLVYDLQIAQRIAP
ncbi:MAG: hypothetical protein WC613_04580 [Candidatus Aenigmatarchaeota archaeon]